MALDTNAFIVMRKAREKKTHIIMEKVGITLMRLDNTTNSKIITTERCN